MAVGQTDPELLRQLDDAKGTDAPVDAVVRLRRPAGSAPEPALIEEQTRRAVDRATETTGEHPVDVHVMGRLAVAYVSGPEKFLRELVEQPEVVSAVANAPSDGEGDDARIAPVPAEASPSAVDELGEPVTETAARQPRSGKRRESP